MRKYNLPSLDKIILGIKATIARFPFAWTVSLAATLSVILATQFNSENDTFLAFVKAAFVSIISFVILLATELFFEREKTKPSYTILIKLALVCLAIGSYFILPPDPFQYYEVTLKYFLAGIFAVSLFFLSPFILHREDNGFWQYLKFIGFSIAITAIYVGVLCLGSGLAISGMQILFELKIPEEFYGQFFQAILGFIGGLLFLSLLPRDIAELEKKQETMERFKYFAQYALLPLWLFYLVILYAYFVKVVVYQDWPKGMVVYLVTALYFIGMVVHWYLFPFRSERKWIRVLGKVSFALALPLLGIYFWALGIRISEYGLTMDRYLAVTLGIWMTVMAVYYLFSKTISFRPAFYVVATGILLISFGPWSVFNLPEKMQVKRLENILLKNNLLVDGKIVKASKQLTCEDRRAVESQVFYLVRTHYYDFSGWGAKKLLTNERYSYAEDIVKQLGLDNAYACDYSTTDAAVVTENKHFNYYGQNQWTASCAITGYDYAVQLLSPEVTGNIMRIEVNGKTEDFVLKIDELVKKLRKIYIDSSLSVPFQDENFQLKVENKSYTGKLIPIEIAGEEDKQVKIDNIRGLLLLKKKK